MKANRPPANAAREVGRAVRRFRRVYQAVMVNPLLRMELYNTARLRDVARATLVATRELDIVQHGTPRILEIDFPGLIAGGR